MKIYNSLTRKKEEFIPIKSDSIKMYVCGPTVYDEPHIGHARSAYIFDVIRRYLEYKNNKVTFVRNVTDVDDKIIDKARKELPNEDLKSAVKTIARKYLDAYHRDMDALGIRRPDKEPKATEYIEKMQKFIKALIDKGAAYQAGSDVYFDIKKAKDYGKLSNQSLDKMEAGARVSHGENKKDPLDFALWKGAKEGEPSWKSPWGAGRPGWHIECSVMSSNILGDEFDIHGGGIDLIFPHHENEVAQSEGAGKRFARVWIHNGLLTINSQKMAKSLGNFITIQDFISKYKDADLLKLFFLSAHYSHPVDYTNERIDEAKKEKERFGILLEKIDKIKGSSKGKGADYFRKRFEEAMDDDFNTPMALAALFDLVTYTNKMLLEKDLSIKGEVPEIAGLKGALTELSGIFGLDLRKTGEDKGGDARQILKLMRERNEARTGKDFKRADEIRKTLSEMGVVLEDTKDGTGWRRKI